MSGGVLAHRPSSGRSSIGVDSAGALHVDRVKFFGTWKGTGQRRPLAGLNETPAPGQVVLFTPAYGRPVPRVAGSAEVVLQPFPATAPNTDLATTVAGVGAGGGESIPPDGAVLMAAGSAARNLQADAPAGTPMTLRLILQPAWTGVVSALGGGPLLVRNGKAIFRSLEDFTNEQVARAEPARGRRPARRRPHHPRRRRRAAARIQRRAHELRARADDAAARRGDRVGAGVGRLGDGCVRRRAAQPAERSQRGARRQGGAPRPVLRRVRRAAAPAAPERRDGPRVRAAELQDRATVDRHRAADRAGQRAACRSSPASRTRRARIRSRSRRTTPRERGGGACRRPTTSGASRRSSARSATTRPSRGSPRRASRPGSATIRFTLARSARPCGSASRRRAASSSARCPPPRLPAGRAAARLGRAAAAWDTRVRRHLRRAPHYTSSVGTSDLTVQFGFRRAG